MPYRIDVEDGEYCVVKIDDGRVMGCHGTRREALAQLAAIEASEEEQDNRA